MPPDPEFIAGIDDAADRERVSGAYAFAVEIYAGPGIEEGAGIDHPIAVARLIDAAGFTDEAVAAALLHDIVEDSRTGTDEIRATFGDEIAGWVEALTEDVSIEDYEDRKAEHRERVLASGSVPTTIYLADKLARTRALSAADEDIDPLRLDHYWDTLRLYAGRRPELPFLAELAAELPELESAIDAEDGG